MQAFSKRPANTTTGTSAYLMFATRCSGISVEGSASLLPRFLLSPDLKRPGLGAGAETKSPWSGGLTNLQQDGGYECD